MGRLREPGASQLRESRVFEVCSPLQPPPVRLSKKGDGVRPTRFDAEFQDQCGENVFYTQPTGWEMHPAKMDASCRVNGVDVQMGLGSVLDCWLTLVFIPEYLTLLVIRVVGERELVCG